MNDKTLKCITMMSHEIKPIYRGALCEKYGNNIALASKTAPCIWNMWSGLWSFLSFLLDVRSEYQCFRCATEAISPNLFNQITPTKINHHKFNNNELRLARNFYYIFIFISPSLISTYNTSLSYSLGLSNFLKLFIIAYSEICTDFNNSNSMLQIF